MTQGTEDYILVWVEEFLKGFPNVVKCTFELFHHRIGYFVYVNKKHLAHGVV